MSKVPLLILPDKFFVSTLQKLYDWKQFTIDLINYWKKTSWYLYAMHYMQITRKVPQDSKPFLYGSECYFVRTEKNYTVLHVNHEILMHKSRTAHDPYE